MARMKRHLDIVLLIILVSFTAGTAHAQGRADQFIKMTDNAPFIKHGFDMKMTLNNNGVFGEWARIGSYYQTPPLLDENGFHEVYGLRYPAGTDNEHIRAGGPWIGGIIRKPDRSQISVASAFYYPYTAKDLIACEMLGYHRKRDTLYQAIFQTSILQENVPNRRYFDDDGDGRIDEDELDGTDNDGDWFIIRDDLNHNFRPDPGEPNVDEDYGAVSEMDTYLAYRDSFSVQEAGGSVTGHIPLNVKVWQKMYSWKTRVKEPIVPVEYYFINGGPWTLDSVYIGIYVEAIPYLHRVDRSGRYFPKLITGYFPEYRTAYVHNTADPEATPLGVTILGSSKPLEQLQITKMHWPWPSPAVYPGPRTNLTQYAAMARGTIAPDYMNENNTGHNDIALLLAVGPFHGVKENDTLKLAIAFVSGNYVVLYPNNLQDNARKAIELYERDYIPASQPASPPLRITANETSITLDWTWHSSDKTPNPLEIWDESNKYVEALPDTHWRKRNPPPDKTKGGRVFEGFRIYRSEYPVFQERQLNLRWQYDVDDDLGFNDQTGIRFTFVDSPVVRGRRYWYAVTSFTIPDYFTIRTEDRRGNVSIDTFITEPIESLLFENVQSFGVPFSTASKLGEVKVVPNPYRTDQNYTFEGGGWEGLSRNWIEDKRLIWFIHLPPKCTIRIFTIAGEIVKTIDHDDAERVARGLAAGQEEFPLLSESNRALASGVYVYTVESDYGKQIDKFVIIR